MALKLAGLKTAKTLSTEIRIENQSSIALPKNAEENIRSIISFLPIEHLRGLEKVRLVDFIKPPQMKNRDADQGRSARSLSSESGKSKCVARSFHRRAASADRRFRQKADGETGF